MHKPGKICTVEAIAGACGIHDIGSWDGWNEPFRVVEENSCSGRAILDHDMVDAQRAVTRYRLFGAFVTKTPVLVIETRHYDG